jgi:hypothetical protein
MKTTKIILSSALIALAVAVLPEATGQIDIYSAAFSSAANLTGFACEARSGSGASYYESAETIFEDEAGIENWMATPFENAAVEEYLRLEQWMAAPFEDAGAEEGLLLQEWMSVPFETTVAEDEIALETWMCAPFETTVAEDEIALEAWMCTPFEVKKTEGCMIAHNR